MKEEVENITKSHTPSSEVLKLSVIPLIDKAIPTVVDGGKSQSKKILYYGSDNKLPNYLWNDIFLKSTVLQSIVNGTRDYVMGSEVKVNIPKWKMLNSEGVVNMDGDTIEDLLSNLAVDYQIFGGFALQILTNAANEVTELYHIDWRYLRLSEDGNTAYYSEKWNLYGNSKIIEYPVFKRGTQLKDSMIYIFKGHNSRGVYPVPGYFGALNALETSIEIGNYHLSNILNNMDPGMIVSFNDGIPSKTEQKAIEKKMIEKYAGAKNAGRLMVTFSKGKDSAPTIAKSPEDNKDKKFEMLYKNTMSEIFISCRAQPIIFGYSYDNTAFNKDEYLQAFELYNKTVVAPIQRDLIRTFNKIFGVNNSLEITPLKIYEVSDESSIN